MASVGVNAKSVESSVPVFVAFGVFRRVYGVDRPIGSMKLCSKMGLMFLLVFLVGDLERLGFLEKRSFLTHPCETQG